MLVNRREALLALSAVALAGCRKTDDHRVAPDASDSDGTWADWRRISFDPTADMPDGERALVLEPPGIAAPPLLVALHGRGESGNGLQIGAQAWARDYDLDRVHRRLGAAPLTAADLLGFVTPQRLAELNASLAANPYRGLCVACPYAPYQAAATLETVAGFRKFVVSDLLPTVRRQARCPEDRAATGIDGVSMGGRLALFIGLSHPEIFGVVGALQPALKIEEVPSFVALTKKAMKLHPVKLRFVTSEEDFFLEPVRALSAELKTAGLPHELFITPGKHGYEFNRGPGSAEMLLWHERMQRGLPSP